MAAKREGSQFPALLQASMAVKREGSLFPALLQASMAAKREGSLSPALLQASGAAKREKSPSTSLLQLYPLRAAPEHAVPGDLQGKRLCRPSQKEADFCRCRGQKGSQEKMKRSA